jgi:site-specific DNA recombinase
MKAAIYIRVSTPGQAINGESLDMQKERLVSYAKAQDWNIYKTYEDGGFSGKDTDRPGFQAMLSDVQQNKFDILLVYKIDRLSRSTLDFHTTMDFLQKQDISFISATQHHV